MSAADARGTAAVARVAEATGAAARLGGAHENPLAQDVDQPLPPPSTLVLFGATGDLAARKLLPAIYNLAIGGRLPDRFHVVGVGRRADDREPFRRHFHDSVKRFSRTGLDEQAWKALEQQIEWVGGDFTNPSLFHTLAERLDHYDKRTGGPTRRVFYLATAPSFFAPLARSLHDADLGKGADPPTALVVEKPFGHDLESALELNRELTEAFDEEQIFRIDHYLGKETVQNLLVLRFANGIFEPLWNRRYIDHVEITVAEDLGIGRRADYYDKSGALRDVIQNHAMQLVSLVAMEPPLNFTANVVRDEKVKALSAVKPWTPEEAARASVRGQYRAGWVGGEEVPGYLEEEGVPPDSQTETYAALRLEIDNWRWAGTPFYLRSGKRLKVRASEIAVQLRPVPHLPFTRSEAEGVVPNLLLISVQPNEGVSLRIVAKVPGSTMDVRPVQMDFNYGAAFLGESPEAYERLLHDVLVGDPTLFTRADEVETAWRIVDPVLKAWAQGNPPLEPYEAGTSGPKGADRLPAADGRAWREL
jgi:glucose-6-phosphate 1-dehydrogenase